METIKRINKKYKDLENVSPQEALTKTLLKKAKGFVLEEVVEEFCKCDETDRLILSKKKITTKEVPPDTTAIKVLIELENLNANRFSSLTDEELNEEKNKLIKMLEGEE